MESYRRGELTFDVTDRGRPGGTPLIALHGFPEDRHCWDGLAAALAAGGHRVLAPDQRGYSPGARPKGRRAYAMHELAADVLALADAAGAERFDLVGHDWGGAVAWDVAARHPQRVRRLVVLSTPHPSALAEAALHSGQLLRSWYMFAFQLPLLPELVFRALGAGAGAGALERDGLDRGSAERYASRFRDIPAMTARLNWYRALPWSACRGTPRIDVPTLFVWGDRDRYLTSHAAELTQRHVTGPYRFEILKNMSHWLPSEAAAVVAPLVLDHLAAATT